MNPPQVVPKLATLVPGETPPTKMGTCAKCGRGNRQVYKGGDVYWCKPCIRHEQRRRAKGQKQEGA